VRGAAINQFSYMGFPMKKVFLLCALALPAVGCADMTPTQQRALTGTAAGAGVGAVFGAIGGNAGLGAGIGAGAGLLGGLIVDQSRRSQDIAFQQGYAAGRGRAPMPPR
jgi:Glycine-zipper domain